MRPRRSSFQTTRVSPVPFGFIWRGCINHKWRVGPALPRNALASVGSPNQRRHLVRKKPRHINPKATSSDPILVPECRDRAEGRRVRIRNDGIRDAGAAIESRGRSSMRHLAITECCQKCQRSHVCTARSSHRRPLLRSRKGNRLRDMSRRFQAYEADSELSSTEKIAPPRRPLGLAPLIQGHVLLGAGACEHFGSQMAFGSHATLPVPAVPVP